jgi:hypothetical protein
LQAIHDAFGDELLVHAIALRNDPALDSDLQPLFDDKKEAVRVRAAAGYARLESIQSTQQHKAATSRKGSQPGVRYGPPPAASPPGIRF